MLRWAFQSGTGNGAATIPDGAQLTMLSVSAGEENALVKIDTFDEFTVPPSQAFTIGAAEFGYLFRWTKDKMGLESQPRCDRFPGEKQIIITFTGSPLSWFVSYVGC